MAFSSINFHYYRFIECSKVIQRFFITNIKILLVLVALALVFCYMDSLKNVLSMDTPHWSVSPYSFDDNLEKMRSNLQYAVIIDAGSSGSRVYIYVWPPHSGDTRQLLHIRMLHDQFGKDVYHSITPGLSSCASTPNNASTYIAPLLKFAEENIPKEKHKETPLYILATAGMRLLSKSTQNAILDCLRRDIAKQYSFLFTANSVKVISGKEEGIYSWISINYLMGRFDHTLAKTPLVTVEYANQRLKRMNTINMIEMGGASTQIAFEIVSQQQYNMLKESFPDNEQSKVSEFNLGCSEHDTNHQYRLFVTTFLTLGANSARKEYVDHLISNTPNFVNTTLQTMERVLFDPCLAIDSSESVTVSKSTANNESSTQFVYHLKGSGDFDHCQQRLKQIIAHDGLNWCNNGTCPFREINKLSVPFQESEFYGLSEFWYSMNDIFQMGGQYSYEKFAAVSSKYCSTSWLVTQDRAKRKLYPNADSKRLLYQCFKSAWMTSILHQGFQMPAQYSNFKSVSMLNGEPVQWTLGALIFRTRFFPLRTLDEQHGVQIHQVHLVNRTGHGHYYAQYLLLGLCMLAVMYSICLYTKRLHTMNTLTGKQAAYYSPCNQNEVYPLFQDDSGADAGQHCAQQDCHKAACKSVLIDFH